MNIINFIIVLLVTVAGLACGLSIYLRNRELAANRVFLLLSIVIIGWTICNYFLQRVDKNLQAAIFFNWFAYILGFLSVFCLFLFAHSYPIESKLIKNKKLLALSIAAAAIFAIICATEPIAGAAYIAANGSIAYTEAPLEILFMTAPFILAILIAFRYKNIIESTKGPVRGQAITMMFVQVLAILIGVSANFMEPLIQSQIEGIYFSPLISLLIVGFIGFAMTRHGLLDIRPYVIRMLIYSVSVAVIYLTLMGVLVVGYGLVTGDSIARSQALLICTLSVAAAVLIVPVVHFFNLASNKYFYRNSYDPQDVINTISSSLVGALDIETMIRTTTALIQKELNVTFCDVYINPDLPIKLIFEGTNKKMFMGVAWQDLVRILDRSENLTATTTDNDLGDDAKLLMKELKLNTVVKLTTKSEKIGLLAVGELKDGTSLTTQDVRLLEIIADEMAIAVQNAFQYEEITQFNRTLKRKIGEATKELQLSNDRLKALDKAKDEFISLASHQLRTPLTSVKGYISMVLDGDAGPLSELQKSLLSQAFVSSQRMVYTISDLLNVSRVKTGSFVIEPKSTYLPDVVEGEVNQLVETAKAREQTLIFNKPQSFPNLNLDESKTRQVVMNLIDNAIYYTPKNGTITVGLYLTKTAAEFTVKDTGIGVAKKDQKNLFTLFFRASNAQKMRPDGTGLGLFMVKKVVVSQGGHMIFKTVEGKGSTFGFSFPLAKLQIVP